MPDTYTDYEVKPEHWDHRQFIDMLIKTSDPAHHPLHISKYPKTIDLTGGDLADNSNDLHIETIADKSGAYERAVTLKRSYVDRSGYEYTGRTIGREGSVQGTVSVRVNKDKVHERFDSVPEPLLVHVHTHPTTDLFFQDLWTVFLDDSDGGSYAGLLKMADGRGAMILKTLETPVMSKGEFESWKRTKDQELKEYQDHMRTFLEKSTNGNIAESMVQEYLSKVRNRRQNMLFDIFRESKIKFYVAEINSDIYKEVSL